MSAKIFVTVVAVAASLNGQTIRRQASIVAGGNRDRGHCSVEVVVDGSAEISLRGDDATVNNLQGQAPQLRRFECTGPIPADPRDFQFNGTEGRGRQELLSPARDGQPAVIRIEDPESGADRYAFEITWRNGGGERRDTDRFDNAPVRFDPNRMVDSCEDAVRRRASDSIGTRDLNFRDAHPDQDHRDQVVGRMEARREGRPDEMFRFTCSVSLESGEIRNVEFFPMEADRGEPGGTSAAVQNCRLAVQQRARQNGYARVEVGEVRPDDRPGRQGFLVGDLRTFGDDGPHSMRFACSVGMRDGDVRSVDIFPAR